MAFYTDIGFNFARTGGAQLPGNGWMDGLATYQARFQSTLSNYKTARKFGASFNLLIHDLWGADTTETSADPFPGDNGDWVNFDNFMTRLISDLKANNMLPGLIIDIWNEPDLSYFWKRSESQYIQMWARAYYRLQRDLPGVPTTGPSYSASHSAGNSWWTNWLAFIAQNRSIPTQYSWHMEGGGGDMESSTAALRSLLAPNGLATTNTININEYAVLGEQVPSAGAWWISQLERVNAIGLRGNWLSTGALHDYMAGLLGKPNAGTPAYNVTGGGYWPAAEFHVYKYYAKNMTGTRCKTQPTPDKRGEVYAVVDTNVVRLLVGSRVTTGTFYIQLQNLHSIGLPLSGKLVIHTYAFKGSTNHFQEFGPPQDLGTYGHDYSGGTLSFPIFQTDSLTAYAFEFRRAA
ncbi:glycoside hydrolase family 39 protein [Zopfia rhizophila CBS 207.26]|uniref:Glycoside hydrolase family 39 protein n=1 Tax=Zopfia rhizophila CBS 207.26 TaxID=1314779 RepID=A0A6A6E0W1_9PEZI|nr:glycoside hydrolase family 39 protein [Zopfia rhizophila CBS 207.26]